jgi:two-component system NtrC family sensor kinase
LPSLRPGLRRPARPADDLHAVVSLADDSAPPSNRRIIVIDDNTAIHEDVRKVLAAAHDTFFELPVIDELMLESPRAPRPLVAPYLIDSATQGAEGVELVKAARQADRPYAVAFVDVRMPPGLDGIETVAQLWREDPELQVVICSAFSDHSWGDIMRRLAPTDGLLILRKPFDNVELRQMAHALVTKWELARAHRRQLVELEDKVHQRTRALLEANEELKRKNEERARMEVDLRLAQKLEAVGQLAAGIAHELNTPIQFLGDSIDFLRQAWTDLHGLQTTFMDILAQVGELRPDLVAEAQRRRQEVDVEFLSAEIPAAFERASDGVRRVTTIVRAMKDFAHVDRRERGPANLNEAIRNTLIVARNEYKYVAEVETDFGELPSVSCNVGDLNQVFLNLIVNAAHAIGDVVGKSGELGRITVRTRAQGQRVSITIADTGAGIPAEIADRVYDPFFTTKEVGKGTGQGLAISRSIVDKHQGTISFESEVGRGTTFTISLPI